MDLMHINARLFYPHSLNFPTLKWKISVKQTSVFMFLLKLLLKKKTCRGFEGQERAQQGADKADAYVFFFFYL